MSTINEILEKNNIKIIAKLRESLNEKVGYWPVDTGKWSELLSYPVNIRWMDKDDRVHNTVVNQSRDFRSYINWLNKIEARNVWQTFNKIKADTTTAVNASDCLSYYYLFLDFDTESKTPTDEERIETLTEALYAADELTEEYGFPDPIVGFSGNGSYLYYRVDDFTSLDIAKFYSALLGLGFKIDPSCKDIGRTSRCFGTVNKKDKDNENNWRSSRLLFVPEKIIPLTREFADDFFSKTKPVVIDEEKKERTEIEACPEKQQETLDYYETHLNSMGISFDIYQEGDSIEIKFETCPFCNDINGVGHAGIIIESDGLPGFNCFHANSCRDENDQKPDIKSINKLIEDFEAQKLSKLESIPDIEEQSEEIILLAKEQLQGQLQEDKDNPLFAYLWQNNHKRITDQEREKRIKEIKDVFELCPKTGIFYEYIRYHLPISDTPVINHLATCLALCSHLLARRVYSYDGGSKLTTPLWLAIVGASGDGRKSTSVNCAVDIIRDDPDFAETVIPSAFTLESYVQKLGFTLENQEAKIHQKDKCIIEYQQNPFYKKGIGFQHHDELGSFLSMLDQGNNAGLKEFFTERYGSENDWDKSTKTSGCLYVWKPAITIIAASTPDWIGEHCTERDLSSGFLARWLFLRSKGKQYSLPIPDRLNDNKQNLLDELEEIKNIVGEVVFSREADDFYWDWCRQRESEDLGIVRPMFSRLSKNARRVAMIFELVSTGELEVSLEAQQMACRFISWVLAETKTLLTQEIVWKGADPNIKKVKDLIFEKKGKHIARREIMRKTHLKTSDLNQIIETLEQAGWIIKEKIGSQNKEFYRKA